MKGSAKYTIEMSRPKVPFIRGQVISKSILNSIYAFLFYLIDYKIAQFLSQPKPRLGECTSYFSFLAQVMKAILVTEKPNKITLNERFSKANIYLLHKIV